MVFLYFLIRMFSNYTTFITIKHSRVLFEIMKISKKNSRSNLEICKLTNTEEYLFAISSLFHPIRMKNLSPDIKRRNRSKVFHNADGNELIIQKSLTVLNFYYIFLILIVASHTVNILLSTLDKLNKF